MGRPSYQHSVGSGCGLHTRSDIWSFTEDVGVLASTGTNHHGA